MRTFLILLLIGGGYYWWSQSQQNSSGGPQDIADLRWEVYSPGALTQGTGPTVVMITADW